MSGPFKMKGNPMQRNFGISPMQNKTSLRNKFKAATQAISEIRDNSTPSQVYASYNRKKADLNKEEKRNNATK
tara:strand:+ start:235 stop:453 length:219 start_codon:yes stop_codon:yes gene_type:complete